MKESATENYTHYSLGAYRPIFLSDSIRLGRDYDGGYIVNGRAVESSRSLLSFGVNDDWSFEADFRNRNRDAQILCFDHSVSIGILREKIVDSLNQILSMRFVLGALALNFGGMRNKFRSFWRAAKLYSNFKSFFSQSYNTFIPKGVSNFSSSKFYDVAEAFRMIPPVRLAEDSVFIKMDIEQSEFRVLPDLLKFDKYINGLVVEFHDLDVFWPLFTNLMDRLLPNFAITHIHGNNFRDLIPDSTTPLLLEVTFLKRKLIREGEIGTQPRAYPIRGLDQPNDKAKKDYELYF